VHRSVLLGITICVSVALGFTASLAPAAMGPGGMGGGGMASSHQPGQGMMMGPGMMGGAGDPGMGRMRRGSGFERPLISEILEAKDQLGLTGEQEKKLRSIRAEFEKEAARRGADIQVAEVDLRELLAEDAPDLGRIETQVKQIAALRGDLRFARIKALREGRAVLSKEQWEKFEAHIRHMGSMGPGGMGHGMMGSQGMGGMMGGQGMAGGMAQHGPTAGQTQASGPAEGMTRTDSTGPVTVAATLRPDRGGQIEVTVKLETHSVDLASYQVETDMSLRNDRGESAQPALQSGSGDSHHREVALAFPGRLADGGAMRLELVVRNLGGVPERILRWDGPFGGR